MYMTIRKPLPPQEQRQIRGGKQMTPTTQSALFAVAFPGSDIGSLDTGSSGDGPGDEHDSFR